MRAEPSGSLFQLDPLSAAVLGLLEAGPLDRSDLLTSLSDALAGDSSPHGAASAASSPPCDGAQALARALDDTLARLVADDLVVAPAAR